MVEFLQRGSDRKTDADDGDEVDDAAATDSDYATGQKRFKSGREGLIPDHLASLS